MRRDRSRCRWLGPIDGLGRLAVIACTLALLARPAAAHKPSDAHLEVVVAGDTLGGSLAVAIRDLDGALAVDLDGDGNVTWAETTASSARIAAYEHERLRIAADASACTFELGAGVLVDFSDGAYWTVPITGRCPHAPTRLAVTYKLLFDVDSLHRGIVQIRSAETSTTVVVRDGAPIVVVVAPDTGIALVADAIRHALTSWTELALFGCLVLGAWRVRLTRRELALGLGTVLLASFATLAFAASGYLKLPAGVIHIAVIASIALALAVAALRAAGVWRSLVLELGLVHGFALAAVLAQKLPTGPGPGAVAAFGVGTVLGELLVLGVLGALGALAALLTRGTRLARGARGPATARRT